jgi:hypothetical protein
MGKTLYLEEFIKKNRIDNEQVLFGFIIKRYKEDLIYVNYKDTEYYNYYLFTGHI